MAGRKKIGSEPWSMDISKTDTADVAAIRAIAQGNADESQQKRFMRWLVEDAAGTYGMTFDPDSDRASAFAEGKRHVGRKVVGIVNADMRIFKTIKERTKKHG